MNKIALIIMLFFTPFTYLHCMKRSANPCWEIQPAQKTTSKVAFNKHDTAPQVPDFKHHELSLEEKYQRLQFLQTELEQVKMQIFYMDAFQKKNISNMRLALAQGPQYSLLDFAVASHFSAGIDLILQYGQPTPFELESSLRMAIGSQNAVLTRLLLEKRAPLNMYTKPLHPCIKKVLRENAEIIYIVATSHIKLVDIVKMELEEVIYIMLKTRKFPLNELNEALDHAAHQQNEQFATLLIEAGANINACIR